MFRFAQHDIVKRLSLYLLALGAISCHAAEVIPSKPDRYFNDYAGIVSKEAALGFNEQLAQFERDTSNQVVVAIFQKMESDSDVADYAQRVAQSWGVGSKEHRNGIVLLVFVADHKMSIQTGYGLEGALPDATAFDIRQNKITPHFRANDYEGGLAAGIDSIFKAIRGEYKGSGKTTKEAKGNKGLGLAFLVFFVVFVVVLYLITRGNRRRGFRYSGLGGPFVGTWSSGSGGGWSSGGSSGGFSGFSGGGGSFGGGGSSGGW